MIAHISTNNGPPFHGWVARVFSLSLGSFLLVWLLFVLPTGSAVLASSPSPATVILRVKPSGVSSGACATWATACNLQYALATPASAAELWVMKGTYKPTKTKDRTATFKLRSGVAVYGGFAGGETKRALRNWNVNVTTLSGDIGAVGLLNDNVYHVVVGTGTDSTAILDGFTIRAGNADSGAMFGSCPKDCGGGMYSEGGSPTLANLIFTANSSKVGGGGMYNYNMSSPLLKNVTFSANKNGGVVNCADSNPTLNRVSFNANEGIGLFNDIHSSPTVSNSNFRGQKGGGQVACVSPAPLTHGSPQAPRSVVGGGIGMYNSDASNPTLNNVTFESNVYGGIINSSSNPVLTNVTLANNSASTWGGGMMNFGSRPTLTNVTFKGNRAAEFGGAMINSNQSKPVLTNVTFSGNNAGKQGGAIYNINSSPIIKNSILWGNTAPNGAEIYNADASSTPAVSDSVVKGGYPGGTHIITANPVLLPLANYGGPTKTMALGLKSSAIGAASPADCPLKDQRGLPRRTANGFCDIGAFEAQPKLILASGGTPQVANINTAFPKPLTVTVLDAYSNRLGGVLVQFKAPGTGASAVLDAATAITGANGTASVKATANGIRGSYKVSAKTAGIAAPAYFSLTNK